MPPHANRGVDALAWFLLSTGYPQVIHRIVSMMNKREVLILRLLRAIREKPSGECYSSGELVLLVQLALNVLDGRANGSRPSPPLWHG